jgi:hypothetical protein
MERQMYVRIGFVLFAVALGGCSLENAAQRPVAGAVARVRIDDGLPIRVYPEKECFRRDTWGVEDRGDQPYSSPQTYTAVYKVVKTSVPIHLGIPVTPETPPLYNEYKVGANRPVMVTVAYSTSIPGYKNAPGVSTFCGPIYSSFVPEQGKDYEVRGVSGKLAGFGGQYCGAEIAEVIKRDDGSAFFKPVAPSPVPPCD